jgi:hypothetical protein
MNHEGLPEFLDRRFRAGSAYELAVFDRLPPEEQALLGELRADPDFYGVLRPRTGSGHTFRAADKNTALLFLTLQAPGRLPSFVWGDERGAVMKAVSALVLDGVLEVEEDGQFVSGPTAAALISPRQGVAETGGRLARLSHDALRYGERLCLNDPSLLTIRLYTFGRQPVTPLWERRLGDRSSVLMFLRAVPDSDVGRELGIRWDLAAGAEQSGWLAWSRKGRQRVPIDRPTHKLYVSPALEALPTTFGVVLNIFSRRGGASFKVGGNAGGLLRPDKLVLYFQELEHLLSVATEVAAQLSGVPAQGVPFSSEIALDGLLSWGMDPPGSERVLTWQEPESWRIWVLRRLAAAMIAAQHEGDSAIPPWQFALERLRHAGVDVDRWTASPTAWQSA